MPLRILGQGVDTFSDTLIVAKPRFDFKEELTQRKVLSFVASLLNPIGPSLSVTFKSRQILQRIIKTSQERGSTTSWNLPARNWTLGWRVAMYFISNADGIHQLHTFTDAKMAQMVAKVYTSTCTQMGWQLHAKPSANPKFYPSKNCGCQNSKKTWTRIVVHIKLILTKCSKVPIRCTILMYLFLKDVYKESSKVQFSTPSHSSSRVSLLSSFPHQENICSYMLWLLLIEIYLFHSHDFASRVQLLNSSIFYYQVK